MNCYIFIRQYKDYFATANFPGQNEVLFGTMFPQEQVLNR